jgi:hypothetical protein
MNKPKLLHRLNDTLMSVMECEIKQLHKVQLAAWIRANTARANSECSSSLNPDPTRSRPWLIDHGDYGPEANAEIDSSELGDCQKEVMRQITYDALERSRHARPGDTPPANYTVDSSIISDQ